MLSGDDWRTTLVWMNATDGATRWKSPTTLCSESLSPRKYPSTLDPPGSSPRNALCKRLTSSLFSRQSRKSTPRSLSSRFSSLVVKSEIDRALPPPPRFAVADSRHDSPNPRGPVPYRRDRPTDGGPPRPPRTGVAKRDAHRRACAVQSIDRIVDDALIMWVHTR